MTVVSDTAHLDDFIRFNALLEAAIEDASRGDPTECARLLALNLARYPARCGEPPLVEHEQRLETHTIDAATARLLAQATSQMLAALAQATGR